MAKGSIVVPVHLMALRPEDTRGVTLINADWDDHLALLDAVYHAGQNEVDPLPVPSLSPGDVIDLRGDEIPFDGLFRVDGVGFTQITLDEFADIKAMDDSWRVQYVIDSYIRT